VFDGERWVGENAYKILVEKSKERDNLRKAQIRA
jgi:hypothetical protein